MTGTACLTHFWLFFQFPCRQPAGLIEGSRRSDEVCMRGCFVLNTLSLPLDLVVVVGGSNDLLVSNSETMVTESYMVPNLVYCCMLAWCCYFA